MKTLIVLVLLFLVSVTTSAQCLDTNDMKVIQKVWDERDYLKVENDSLYSKVEILNLRVMNFKDKIISLNDIIQRKESQILKLEYEPKTVVKQSNYSFWEIAGIVLLSAAVGVGTGVIIK